MWKLAQAERRELKQLRAEMAAIKQQQEQQQQEQHVAGTSKL